jgi:hypothetical protein
MHAPGSFYIFLSHLAASRLSVMLPFIFLHFIQLNAPHSGEAHKNARPDCCCYIIYKLSPHIRVL